MSLCQNKLQQLWQSKHIYFNSNKRERIQCRNFKWTAQETWADTRMWFHRCTQTLLLQLNILMESNHQHNLNISLAHLQNYFIVKYFRCGRLYHVAAHSSLLRGGEERARTGGGAGQESAPVQTSGKYFPSFIRAQILLGYLIRTKYFLALGNSRLRDWM